MKTNVLTPKPKKLTHEGAVAYQHLKPLQELRRSVLACLLWEDSFYESGVSVADRIAQLVPQCKPQDVAALAVEARSQQHLRHVPLLLVCLLTKTHNGDSLVSETVQKVIQRADELAEILAIYQKLYGADTPISYQLKKGIAKAFPKFNEYSLAKYNRDGAIKLRDALFLCHPRPQDEEQAQLWKRLAENKLATPETWEVELSAGKNKRETFERLIREDKLGYFATLRNLRNMVQAGCDLDLVRQAILARKGGADKVLPFRYIAAARACPQLEPALDQALLASLDALPALAGTTAVLVDVSGSMAQALSAKSDLTRLDAACALAAICPGSVRLFSFSERLVEVPPRKGMSGVDALKNSQPHQGTHLFDAVHQVNQNVAYDRVIVITDEQATAEAYSRNMLQGTLKTLPDPQGKGYMINVATEKHGVGYGKWTHLDGFSENVLRYIHEAEKELAAQ